jgi:diphthine-ammonia ligase
MKLIQEAKWISNINRLNKIKVNPSKEKLKQSIIESIKKSSKKDNAVLFSGGIDSTLIALILKKLNKQFTCYTIGTKNSKDVEFAKDIAATLNLKLKVRILKLNEIEEYLKQTIKILKDKDPVRLSIATVITAAIDLAKQDNQDNLFSGLGAEELFIGYKKYKISKTPIKDCWEGLKTTWKRDISRDIAIAKRLNVNLNTPLLQNEVIIQAMAFPLDKKLSKDQDKIILREIALDLGIPREFAYRKKVAAQYGSGFDKAITKLAKRKGFKTKREYINSL